MRLVSATCLLSCAVVTHVTASAPVDGGVIHGDCGDGSTQLSNINWKGALNTCQTGYFGVSPYYAEDYVRSYKATCDGNSSIKLQYYSDRQCGKPLSATANGLQENFYKSQSCIVKCNLESYKLLQPVHIQRVGVSGSFGKQVLQFENCDDVTESFASQMETYTSYSGACLPAHGSQSPLEFSSSATCVDGKLEMYCSTIDRCTESSSEFANVFSSYTEHEGCFIANTESHSYRYLCPKSGSDTESNRVDAVSPSAFLNRKLLTHIDYTQPQSDETKCKDSGLSVSRNWNELVGNCQFNGYGYGQTSKLAWSKSDCDISSRTGNIVAKVQHYSTKEDCENNNAVAVGTEFLNPDKNGFVNCPSSTLHLQAVRCESVQSSEPIVRFEGFTVNDPAGGDNKGTGDFNAQVTDTLRCNQTDSNQNEMEIDLSDFSSEVVILDSQHKIFSSQNKCISVCPTGQDRESFFSLKVSCLADQTPNIVLFNNCGCDGESDIVISPISETDRCGLYDLRVQQVRRTLAARFSCLWPTSSVEPTLNDDVPNEYGESGLHLTIIVAAIILFFFVIMCFKNSSRREEVEKMGGINAIVSSRFPTVSNLQQSTRRLIGGRNITIVRSKTAGGSTIELMGTKEIAPDDIEIGTLVASRPSSQVFSGTYKGTQVAIKEVLGEDGNDKSANKDKSAFLREIELLSQLDHPSIVRLFGATIAPDSERPGKFRKLIVMELARCSLRDVIRGSSPYAIAVALAWMEQMLSGLAYLHDSGVVHGDLKPGNVLVDMAGNAKLCDFGIAKHESDTFDLEGKGPDVSVTPSFMAPELFAKPGRKVTRQSDVYAFGVVLWEVLHNHLPHPDEWSHSKIISKVCKDEYRPAIDEACPANLRVLVERSWSQLPTQRPPANILLEEMTNLLGAMSNAKRNSSGAHLFEKGDVVSVWNSDKHSFLAGKGTVVSVRQDNKFEIVMKGKKRNMIMEPENLLLSDKPLLKVR